MSIYLCAFISTCYGLTRPSSGAMDVKISLHMHCNTPPAHTLLRTDT